MPEPNIEAVITSVRGQGVDMYFFTKVTSSIPDSKVQIDTIVTFSISAYQDAKHKPQFGQLVILEDIVRFEKGWRARSVRPIHAN